MFGGYAFQTVGIAETLHRKPRLSPISVVLVPYDSLLEARISGWPWAGAFASLRDLTSPFRARESRSQSRRPAGDGVVGCVCAQIIFIETLRARGISLPDSVSCRSP